MTDPTLDTQELTEALDEVSERIRVKEVNDALYKGTLEVKIRCSYDENGIVRMWWIELFAGEHVIESIRRGNRDDVPVEVSRLETLATTLRRYKVTYEKFDK